MPLDQVPEIKADPTRVTFATTGGWRRNPNGRFEEIKEALAIDRGSGGSYYACNFPGGEYIPKYKYRVYPYERKILRRILAERA